MGRNSSDGDICNDGGNIALTKGLYGIEATTYWPPRETDDFDIFFMTNPSFLFTFQIYLVSQIKWWLLMTRKGGVIMLETFHFSCPNPWSSPSYIPGSHRSQEWSSEECSRLPCQRCRKIKVLSFSLSTLGSKHIFKHCQKIGWQCEW